MNRNARGDRVWLAYASRWLKGINPVAGGRILIAAFLLALAIGSAGLAPSVQAAGDPGVVSFEVWAFPNPKETQVLCVNQVQPFYVSVHKNIQKTIDGTKYDFPAGAVSFSKITGTVQPSNIGVLNHSQDSSELAVLSGSVAGSANFEFIAKKPGTATLTFTADVGGRETGSSDASVSGQSYSATKAVITLKVIHCKYKAKTTGKFASNPTNDPTILPPPIVARMENAELTADANGHFTGSGSMRWFGGTRVSVVEGGLTCTIVEKFSASSPVALTGEVSDDGQFTLNLTYDMVWSSFTETCSAGGAVASSSGTLPYILDPMKIIMPDSGGSLSQPQGYNQSSFMGSVAIEVTPEEDTASAFNPSGPAASPGSLSPWAAMLWNNFPRWGSGALSLALHP